MTLFNQVNNLTYWLNENNFTGSILFCGDNDSYFIEVKKGNNVLYSHIIESISKKTEKMVVFELSTIANNLLNIKQNYNVKEEKKEQ